MYTCECATVPVDDWQELTFFCILWVLGIELWSLGLAACAFLTKPSHLPKISMFKEPLWLCEKTAFGN